MPTKLNIKFTHQLAEQLPADVVYRIMQYACKAYHPTATMIKKAIKDKHTIKDVEGYYYPILSTRPSSVLGGAHINPVLYVERDCAEMFKEVDVYEMYRKCPPKWFAKLTKQYKQRPLSREYRDNILDYRNMIKEVWATGQGRTKRTASKAYELYKIISNCPTCVC
jgi:hypothetical protein